MSPGIFDPNIAGYGGFDCCRTFPILFPHFTMEKQLLLFHNLAIIEVITDWSNWLSKRPKEAS